MWTDRAQSPDQQCHCTPESSHLEGGEWPASSDSKEAGGELWLRGAGKPLGKEQSYKPYFGVKDLLGNACLPSLLFTT